MQYKSYKYLPKDMLELTYECPVCHKDHTVKVNQYRFEEYSDTHIHIQDAFPELSAAERELMITGICDPCFKTAGNER
jgi:hypothetical protein